MRVKSIITFSLISSFFLFSLISIWKILSTLQGIELKTLNFNFYFLSGIIISLISIPELNSPDPMFVKRDPPLEDLYKVPPPLK